MTLWPQRIALFVQPNVLLFGNWVVVIYVIGFSIA